MLSFARVSAYLCYLNTHGQMNSYKITFIAIAEDFITRDDGEWARQLLTKTQQYDSEQRLAELAKAACHYLDRTAI